MAKVYKHYYYDPTSDDFANCKIVTKETPKHYEYLPKNIFYKIFKPIVYYLVVPIVSLIEMCILRGKIHNKEVLKSMKKRKEGYFVYGNHTSKANDAFSTPMLSFPRQCYVIAHPDVISIKGLSLLVRFLGVFPTPNSINTYIDLLKSVDKVYKKG